MHLHVDDDAFLRAPVGLVYRRLTDIGAWSGWWPGVTAERVRGDDEAWDLAIGNRPRLRVHAVPGTWRHDEGFRLGLSGDLEGTLEFWLEDAHDGTVIHVILQAATSARRPLRALSRFRRTVRRGLWAFKDGLQGEVRAAVGMEL